MRLQFYKYATNWPKVSLKTLWQVYQHHHQIFLKPFADPVSEMLSTFYRFCKNVGRGFIQSLIIEECRKYKSVMTSTYSQTRSCTHASCVGFVVPIWPQKLRNIGFSHGNLMVHIERACQLHHVTIALATAKALSISCLRLVIFLIRKVFILGKVD